MSIGKTVGILLALLAITFAINSAVDPYGFNGTGFVNLPRSVSETWVQDYKFTQVARTRPRTIVLGNSRAWRGISPTGSVLLSGGYNFASPSLSVLDFLDQIKFAQTCAPLKRVFLVLDPNVFESGRGKVVMRPEINYSKCEKSSLPAAVKYFKENISVKQLLASISVLVGREKAIYSPDGTNISPNESDTEARTLAHFETSLQNYLQGGWESRMTPHGKRIETRTAGGGDTLQSLRSIFQFAAQHKIKVIVVFPPLHADLQVVARILGLEDAIWDIKYRVLKAAQSVRFSPGGEVEIYDLLTVNRMTVWKVGDLSGGRGQTEAAYVDVSHFMPTIGARMMRDIERHPESLRLTLENFSEKQRSARSALTGYIAGGSLAVRIAKAVCSKKPDLSFCSNLRDYK